MRIIVDGDSCPREVREIVLRRAAKEDIETVFVADRQLPLPEHAVMVLVEGGPDAADDHIHAIAGREDLVITRDIPLAARLVESGVAVINDRGRAFGPENMNELRSLRDFATELRERGLHSLGGRSYSHKERKAFADEFDRSIQRLVGKHR